MKNKTMVLKKVGIGLGILLFLIKTVGAWGSNSLDGWILGTNKPTVPDTGQTGFREAPTGYGGSSIYVPIGTHGFHYPASTGGGEGSITFFIYDPGKCLDPEKNSPFLGPGWGMDNSNGQSICVGIGRVGGTFGCLGYAPRSSLYHDPRWFKDGVRGSFNTPWNPGWYKWTVQGGMDDITFILHDVVYDSIDGFSGYSLVQGDCIQSYNSNSYLGVWASIFGDGWQSFYVVGDPSNGFEDISVFIISGTGIFNGAGDGVPVSKEYKNKTWSDIKKLFR